MEWSMYRVLEKVLNNSAYIFLEMMIKLGYKLAIAMQIGIFTFGFDDYRRLCSHAGG